MERAAGSAGSRREVMASLWRQGRGEADHSPWSKSNYPAAPDTLVRPQTALPARPIVVLPKGSVTPSVACESRLLEIEPPAVIPHKPVEEVPAVETQRPPADLEVKSRAKCAVFDPLRLYVNTFKRRSEEIHKAPAKARAKAVKTLLQDLAEVRKL